MSTEINIVYGDTRHYTLSDITDDDGAAVDLATGTLVFTAVDRIGGTELLVKTSETDGGIILDDEIPNAAELEITATDLADVDNTWSTLPYELRFWRDGYPQTPIRGVVRITPGIGEEAGS